MRRVIHALVLVCLLLGTIAPAALGAPTAPAASAVDWLRTQQQADGGFAGFSGASDPGVTVDAALAFAAAGIDPDLVAVAGQSIIDFLRARADQYSTTTAGAAKLILAAVASGLNPRDFGGIDLVARLEAHLDPATGLFDPQIFVHAYGMLALAAAGVPVPPAAIDAVTAAQAADGGWAFTGDPAPGAADSNTTAIVIQALAAAGERTSPAIDRGLGYLRAAQTDDGSFVYQVGAETPAVGDANSTALAIQALLAAGERRDSPTVQSALAALTRFQSESGALRYRDDVPGDNLLATVQAVPALALQPLPIAAQPGFGRATARERAMQPAAPKAGCVYYAETGHNLCAGFRSYWIEYGGLAVYGYPITEEFVENGRTVQYFERARFEWHPGVWPERYDVLLGLVGNEVTADRRGEVPFQPVDARAQAGCLYFAETQHSLCGGFNSYWQRFGGLAVFGYPISEEFVENGRTVQYFERARFEWHPGVTPAHYDVLGGLLGAELLSAGERAQR
ncbi:MAG: terpene cyclase/mutase family protein [Sphaerobacter sp.]|nr:terpene cyclase/mutase family protein [Sphaerobacter sp.]